MTKAFVVGHPIEHSRSPLIHGYWLKRVRARRLLRADRRGAGGFRRLPENLRRQGFAGGNVTIPHKEAAFAGVDARTGRAERLRAVNTLWLEDGVLWGDNTDVLGFMAHLDQSLGAAGTKESGRRW